MKKLRILLLSLMLLLLTGLAGCSEELAGDMGDSSILSSQVSAGSSALSSQMQSYEEDTSGSAAGYDESSSSDLSIASDTSESSLSDISSVTEEASEADGNLSVEEDGCYTDKDHVALYIYTYGCLPSNYITKDEAKSLGWNSKKGNLDEVAPGKSIGGDYFGNREGLLPKKKGRSYTECDINYTGGYRGGERIVFSNDGLVYYSADHYQDFELLYGEE